MRPSALLLALTPFFLATPTAAIAPDVQQAILHIIEVQVAMSHVEDSLAKFINFLNQAPSGEATNMGKQLSYELAKGFHGMESAVKKAAALNYDAYSTMRGSETSGWNSHCYFPKINQLKKNLLYTSNTILRSNSMTHDLPRKLHRLLVDQFILSIDEIDLMLESCGVIKLTELDLLQDLTIMSGVEGDVEFFAALYEYKA